MYRQSPVGLEPDSLGKAALYLTFDDSIYVIDHNPVVDGGLTLR